MTDPHGAQWSGADRSVQWGGGKALVGVFAGGFGHEQSLASELLQLKQTCS